jgi:hypothetical protein
MPKRAPPSRGHSGLTSLFLATLAVEVHVHDTYFVVAHFHYIMVGGVVMGYLGGIHFWRPKISGRLDPEGWARFAALMVFVGFNLTFFPNSCWATSGCRGAITFTGRVPGVERDVGGGGLNSRAWICHSVGVLDLVEALWPCRRPEPYHVAGVGIPGY